MCPPSQRLFDEVGQLWTGVVSSRRGFPRNGRQVLLWSEPDLSRLLVMAKPAASSRDSVSS